MHNVGRVFAPAVAYEATLWKTIDQLVADMLDCAQHTEFEMICTLQDMFGMPEEQAADMFYAAMRRLNGW